MVWGLPGKENSQKWMLLAFHLQCIISFPGPTAHWCQFTSSLGEFPGYWALVSWATAHVVVQCLFPFAFQISVFHSLFSFALDFIRVSSLRPTYLHQFGRPFTCTLFGMSFQAWDWLWYPLLWSQRQTKFLPWSGFELCNMCNIIYSVAVLCRSNGRTFC